MSDRLFRAHAADYSYPQSLPSAGVIENHLSRVSRSKTRPLSLKLFKNDCEAKGVGSGVRDEVQSPTVFKHDHPALGEI